MAQSRWTNVDRVIATEPGKSARAIRNVTNTLDILDSHFPRFPVLPGVLILGSMGSLAAQILEEHTGKTWRMARAEQIRFRHFVQPGDQMELAVDIKELTDDTCVCTGSARVDGKPVTTVRAIRLVPLAAGGDQ